MMTDDSSQTGATSTGSSDTNTGVESQNSNDTSNPAQGATPPAGESQSAAAPAVGADGKPVAPAAPVYQPNFKFKAFGKEHEIEEIYRGLIKDKDTEEKIRKLHEKAFAMEPFQQESKKFKTDFEQYKTQTEPSMRALNHFNHLLKNKDWDNFFGGLKVPEEEIFNWVQKRLDLRALPKEQQDEIARQAQVRQQNYQYENQLTESQTQYQQLATQTRELQLDNVLARTDISSQAEKIQAVLGNEGSFRDLVIEEAVNYFNRTGQDLPANQAVQFTIDKYSKFLGAQNQGANPNPQVINGAGAPQGQATKEVPIIPHVGGSAKSPIKKSPRSIEDLKKMGQEAARRENQI